MTDKYKTWNRKQLSDEKIKLNNSKMRLLKEEKKIKEELGNVSMNISELDRELKKRF
jgi:hypothetical protein